MEKEVNVKEARANVMVYISESPPMDKVLNKIKVESLSGKLYYDWNFPDSIMAKQSSYVAYLELLGFHVAIDRKYEGSANLRTTCYMHISW